MEEPPKQVVYKDIGEFLFEIGLGEFFFAFTQNGVSDYAGLKNCSDSFLTEKVGMKKIHVAKLQRAMKTAIINDGVSNEAPIIQKSNDEEVTAVAVNNDFPSFTPPKKADECGVWDMKSFFRFIICSA